MFPYGFKSKWYRWYDFPYSVSAMILYYRTQISLSNLSISIVHIYSLNLVSQHSSMLVCFRKELLSPFTHIYTHQCSLFRNSLQCSHIETEKLFDMCVHEHIKTEGDVRHCGLNLSLLYSLERGSQTELGGH